MRPLPDEGARTPALCRDLARSEVRAISGIRRCARGAKFALMHVTWRPRAKGHQRRVARAASSTRTCFAPSQTRDRARRFDPPTRMGSAHRASCVSCFARNAAFRSRGRFPRRANRSLCTPEWAPPYIVLAYVLALDRRIHRGRPARRTDGLDHGHLAPSRLAPKSSSRPRVVLAPGARSTRRPSGR